MPFFGGAARGCRECRRRVGRLVNLDAGAAVRLDKPLFERFERLGLCGRRRRQRKKQDRKNCFHHSESVSKSSGLRPKVFKKSDNGIRRRPIFFTASPTRSRSAKETVMRCVSARCNFRCTA